MFRFSQNIGRNTRKFDMFIWETVCLIILVFRLETSDCIGWPAGTYGIPKPASGCPWADGFQWKTGWRSQDTNDDYSNNSKSAEFHLDGEVDNKKVNRSFCMKTDATSDRNRSAWPSGQYCIYKKRVCPAGLTKGNVKWDDDDANVTFTVKGGTLPGGKYNYNTEIRFCCKIDGDKNKPILLPTKTPFFLLAYNSSKCQMVKWATASLEWIYYDTEDRNQNSDKAGGKYPYEAGKKHPTIYYCYYRGCNETLTRLSGTFHSPNYPQKYPDGQYCSWRITVSSPQQIHLTFTDFSLQSENNTDSLYVYDGDNATGKVLGVFYGAHPPPKEGIQSSSNHVFVIFKSDRNDSYTGFNASYTAVNYPVSTVAITTTPMPTTSIPEGTSSPTVTSKTLEKTTVSREPTSREGGKNDQRKGSEGKGLNIPAIVVPLVALVFIIVWLVAGFFYCKRRRRKRDEQRTPRQVVYSRSNGEIPMSLENPCYGRSKVETPMAVENSFYDCGFILENKACSSAENDLYTEVKDECKNGEMNGQKNTENPLYETAEGDAVLNIVAVCSEKDDG